MRIIVIIFVIVASLYPAYGQSDFYIRNISWHTGIILPVDSLSVSLIPELKGFSDYDFVEFGMGDEVYYQAEDPSYADAAKAAVVPTDAVIKVDGKMYSPEDMANYSRGYFYKIKIDNESYKKLLQYISNSIKRNSNKAIITSKKHNGRIIFYKSTETFHVFNTCNTWVAGGLEDSGIVESTGIVLRSDDLIKVLDKIGIRLN